MTDITPLAKNLNWHQAEELQRTLHPGKLYLKTPNTKDNERILAIVELGEQFVLAVITTCSAGEDLCPLCTALSYICLLVPRDIHEEPPVVGKNPLYVWISQGF